MSDVQRVEAAAEMLSPYVDYQNDGEAWRQADALVALLDVHDRRNGIVRVRQWPCVGFALAAGDAAPAVQQDEPREPRTCGRDGDCCLDSPARVSRDVPEEPR